jgi:hypothetical protein
MRPVWPPFRTGGWPSLSRYLVCGTLALPMLPTIPWVLRPAEDAGLRMAV